MPILGAHLSIAKGFHKAVERAAALGMETLQVFTQSPSRWAVKPAMPAGKASLRLGKSLTKNNNQGRAKPILEAEAARFRSTLTELSVAHPIAHNSYLINLASPDETLWRRSIEAMVVELRRAEQLGLTYVVTHPGASVESGEERGLKRVVAALDEIHAQTPGVDAQILLETTAGQGSCLGHRFEHLATILDQVESPERLGVCVDTCHVFAAGYPLGTPSQYRATMKKLATTVGLEKVRAFHLNDSKRELNSRVDRHEHIGKGRLGLEPFRHLLNDPRFQHVPMYLETPKGTLEGEDLDAINLRTLRGLVEPEAGGC
ncbi:MAG TPA: deoxyribonuclease IV [Pirellulales bacterium]|nr:deoxyribonuclease IV [Pirellulales bacterium]